jgi:hypothetical protein
MDKKGKMEQERNKGKRIRGVHSCVSQFKEKLETLTIYVNKCVEALNYSGGIRLRRLQSEIIFTYLFSIYEAFLVCMVYQGLIVDKEKTLRLFPSNNGIKNIVSNWNAEYQNLQSHAANIVNFKNNKFSDFKKIFKNLFECELFPDPSDEQLIIRFKDYRNILIHHQGVVEKSYLNVVGNTPEIVESKIRREYGRDILYEIDREKLTDFIIKVMDSISRCLEHYGKSL